CGQGTHWPTF
nr:immunoglobulin light chain junction region [Macaca mulatta]